MERPPIQLDYENPDETRPAQDVSPFTQSLLGYAVFALIALIAAFTVLFIHWPGTIVIVALILATLLSIIAHYGLRWHEFAPAMGVALALGLFIIAILGLGWLVIKML